MSRTAGWNAGCSVCNQRPRRRGQTTQGGDQCEQACGRFRDGSGSTAGSPAAEAGLPDQKVIAVHGAVAVGVTLSLGGSGLRTKPRLPDQEVIPVN